MTPGTGTRVEGGVSYDDGLTFLSTMHESNIMTFLEIIEVIPLLEEVQNLTGLTAVDLVIILFGDTTLLGGKPMKVYTKTGDNGQTSLIGGKVVSKSDLRVNAYGTLDEVNAFVGVAIEWLEDNEALQAELSHIQQLLFDCGTDLASSSKLKPYRISEKDVQWLEEKIDEHMNQLPPLRRFILPGGSKEAAYLHLARTVTRRGEREIVKLSVQEEINQHVLRCINRLSDYFFVIARFTNATRGVFDRFYK